MECATYRPRMIHAIEGYFANKVKYEMATKGRTLNNEELVPYIMAWLDYGLTLFFLHLWHNQIMYNHTSFMCNYLRLVLGWNFFKVFNLDHW